MPKQRSQTPEQQQRDNRSNQLNPNNDRYWKSRGQPGRPPSEHPSMSGSSPKAMSGPSPKAKSGPSPKAK